MDFFKIRRKSADPEFCRIFKNLLESELKYCKLCLQTESEVDLVRPKQVQKLLGCLTNLRLDLSNALACVYCEGRAAAAVQIIRALHYAKDVSILIESLNNQIYKGQWERFINKECSVADLRPKLKSNILKCSNNLNICKNLHLNITETLTIDLIADPKFIKEIDKQNTFGKKDEIVISDESDEDCVLLPKINAKPIEQLLQRPNTQTESTNIIENDPLSNIIFTPIAMNSGIVMQNPVSMNSGILPMQTDNQTGVLYVVDGKGSMTLHPLFKRNDSSYEVPTLTLSTLNQAQALNTVSPLINNNQLTMVKNSDCTNDVLPKIISTSSVKEIVNVDNGITLPIITNAKSLNATAVEEGSEEGFLKRVLDKDGDIEPGGKREKETDWEDKIPMDLISLADNSGPTARFRSFRQNTVIRRIR